MTKRLRFLVCFLVFAFVFKTALVFARPQADRQKLLNVLGEISLSFEANAGQAEEEVKFLSRGNGSVLYLTGEGAVVSVNASRPAVFKIGFAGSNPNPDISGLEELPGKSNYFIGNKPENWQSGISTFAKVRYQEIYPGIDLVFYGNQRQVEFDFVVSPGADPKAVRLDFQSVDKMKIEKNGNILLREGKEEIHILVPQIYQELDGIRQPVAGRYVRKGRNQVDFEVAEYDLQKPLVIDPVLGFSTYLGGTSGDESAFGIDVDNSGHAYVTGYTISNTTFPVTAGAFDTTSNGNRDVFVTKFHPSGTSLIYSTYIGGSGSEDACGIAVDGSGNAYVTGRVSSTNFPVVNGFQDTLYPGSNDAFVSKLNPAGSALLYSTYFGGAGAEYFTGQTEGDIVVDDSGFAYIAGDCVGAAASPFPTTPGAFQTVHPGGPHDAFVAKFNTNAADATSRIYCTFVGGNNHDSNLGLAVDDSGNAYITGTTNSTNFPTMNAYQSTFTAGVANSYVTKLNATGAALLYSTYLSPVSLLDCDADDSGNVYVTGGTSAASFPTTAGAYQTSYGGGIFDAVLSKFNTHASGPASLIYSSYLGASGVSTNGFDIGNAIDVDSSGNVFLAGRTASDNFPIKDSAQGTYGGADDAFITKLNPALSDSAALIFSTYLGGTHGDFAFDQAIDADGNVYVTGFTNSPNFPTRNPYQANLRVNLVVDCFVTKLGGATCAAAKGDMNGDASLAPADVVLMLNCVYLASGACDLCFADVTCDGGLSPADIVKLLNMVYLGEPVGC